MDPRTSASHQHPSTVIQIEEESEDPEHQATSQVPIKQGSELTGCELIMKEIEYVGASGSQNPKCGGLMARALWLAEQAGASRVPSVKRFQIKKVREYGGGQKSTSAKLDREQPFMVESKLIMASTSTISSVKLDPPDAENAKRRSPVAAPEKAASRDDDQTLKKTFTDKTDCKKSIGETRKKDVIQVGQEVPTCLPSTSKIVQIKAEPQYERPGPPDGQPTANQKPGQEVENGMAFEAEPVVKLEPQKDEAENADTLVGVAGDPYLKVVSANSSINDELFCEFCGFRALSRQNFNNHLRAHLKEKVYLCGICGHLTNKKANLVMHQRSHSQKSKQAAGNIMGYAVHKSAVSPPRTLLRCDYCTYTTAEFVRLKNHLLTHLKEKERHYRYECDKCNYKTGQKQRMIMHAKSHKKIIIFLCDICLYETCNREKMFKHRETHVAQQR